MPITSNGHPWGGERESAKMTGLRLPPPCRGLRDQFPVRRLGNEVHSRRLSGVRRVNHRGTVVLAIGRCPASAVPNHQGIVSSPTRSRRRPTTSLFTRGHRDDQCGSSSCLEPVWTEPARAYPRSRPRQGLPPAQAPAKFRRLLRLRARLLRLLRPRQDRPGSQAPTKVSPGPRPRARSPRLLRLPARCRRLLRPRARSPRPLAPRRSRPAPGSDQDRPGSLRPQQDRARAPGSGQGCPGSPGSEQDRPGSSGPSKIAPAPQAPSKVSPAPQAPGKIAPAPQAPAKVSPAPQAPSKIAPAPYAPSKVSPAPQAPSKIAPAPYAPSKVSPAPRLRPRCCRRPRSLLLPRCRPRPLDSIDLGNVAVNGIARRGTCHPRIRHACERFNPVTAGLLGSPAVTFISNPHPGRPAASIPLTANDQWSRIWSRSTPICSSAGNRGSSIAL